MKGTMANKEIDVTIRTSDAKTIAGLLALDAHITTANATTATVMIHPQRYVKEKPEDGDFI
jgi:hypothetical protein